MIVMLTIYLSCFSLLKSLVVLLKTRLNVDVISVIIES